MSGIPVLIWAFVGSSAWTLGSQRACHLSATGRTNASPSWSEQERLRSMSDVTV
jgi:hypothetical protein